MGMSAQHPASPRRQQRDRMPRRAAARDRSPSPATLPAPPGLCEAVAPELRCHLGPLGGTRVRDSRRAPCDGHAGCPNHPRDGHRGIRPRYDADRPDDAVTAPLAVRRRRATGRGTPVSQSAPRNLPAVSETFSRASSTVPETFLRASSTVPETCLLYTSDAADDLLC